MKQLELYVLNAVSDFHKLTGYALHAGTLVAEILLILGRIGSEFYQITWVKVTHMALRRT